MKVHIVNYGYGSYDSAQEGVLAIYSTQELAEAHVKGALEYHKKIIVPLIRKLRKLSGITRQAEIHELWKEIDHATLNNPWHRSIPVDEPDSYYVGTFEQEVLDKLPV